MGIRGPTLTADLSVVDITTIPRIRPPASLSPAEAKTFAAIIAMAPADHFAPSDAPIVAVYAQAILLNQHSFKQIGEGDLEAFPVWEKSSRVMGAIATKLRLVPSARIHPETAGRRATSKRFQTFTYDSMENDE